MYRLILVFSLLTLTACGGGGGGGGGGRAINPPPPPANVAPTITVIADQMVDEGEMLSITASASDSDGSITGYSWIQTSGTTVTLENAATATVNFIAPAADSDSVIILRVTATPTLSRKNFCRARSKAKL